MHFADGVVFLKYFDCHCDTLVEMYRSNNGFYGNGCDCDRSLIADGDEAHVVYAVFNDGSFRREDMLKIMKYFNSRLSEIKNGRAYLSIEGLGNQPDFDISDIAVYKKLGVRMMSLTWNNDNPLCGGIENNSYGLTPLGRAVINEMKQSGIVADVSHSSDKGCYDIIETFGGGVCASHSNSRTVCKNTRNLTDEQFKMIAQSGGVAGINFYNPFLSEKPADTDDIVRHIEYFLNIGGEYSIGFGSDFDGMDLKPRGIENCGSFSLIYDILLAKKYSKSFINSLFFDNFSEIFKKYEF